MSFADQPLVRLGHSALPPSRAPPHIRRDGRLPARPGRPSPEPGQPADAAATEVDEALATAQCTWKLTAHDVLGERAARVWPRHDRTKGHAGPVRAAGGPLSLVSGVTRLQRHDPASGRLHPVINKSAVEQGQGRRRTSPDTRSSAFTQRA